MQDDNRGVAEALNETVCGCSDCDCPGLIARGTFQMLLAPRTPDTHHRLRTLQTLTAEPLLPLYGRGSDIVRWLATNVHPGSGEVAVSTGGAVEDAAVAAAPGWSGSGGPTVGSNASDLWPVGASDLIASNPLAKAILKRIGDNGVVRIETSAAEHNAGACSTHSMGMPVRRPPHAVRCRHLEPQQQLFRRCLSHISARNLRLLSPELRGLNTLLPAPENACLSPVLLRRTFFFFFELTRDMFLSPGPQVACHITTHRSVPRRGFCRGMSKSRTRFEHPQ